MQSLQTSNLRPSPLDPLRKRTSHLRNARKPARVSFISATAAAPKREQDPKKRVVITGTGLVSVFGNDVNTYYEKLLAGESGISPIDRFDASKFPTRFAGQIRGFSSEGYIDGKNDRRLDDCLRYCLVAGKKALEDADLGGEKLSKVKILLILMILHVGFRTYVNVCRSLCYIASSVCFRVFFSLLNLRVFKFGAWCRPLCSLAMHDFLQGYLLSYLQVECFKNYCFIDLVSL